MYGPPKGAIVGLFYLAAFGLICAALIAVCGAGWLIWFALNHIKIIW